MVLYGDERLRRMSAAGRADALARRYARLWSWVFPRLPVPRRWVTLEVRGRRSSYPVCALAPRGSGSGASS